MESKPPRVKNVHVGASGKRELLTAEDFDAYAKMNLQSKT